MTNKTIHLDKDELYPVYLVVEPPTTYLGAKRAIEVDSRTVAKWRHAIEAFDQAQGEMRVAYEAAADR
jgi:hypothetical protein